MTQTCPCVDPAPLHERSNTGLPPANFIYTTACPFHKRKTGTNGHFLRFFNWAGEGTSGGARNYLPENSFRDLLKAVVCVGGRGTQPSGSETWLTERTT